MPWNATITGDTGAPAEAIRDDVQAALDSIEGATTGSVDGTDGNGTAFSFALTRTPDLEDDGSEATGEIDDD